MAPPPKRRKTTEQRYFCTSCVTSRLARLFPKYNPTPDCEHLINTCTACLKKWVQSQVDDGALEDGPEHSHVVGVKCPECDGIMRNINIKIAATKKTYNRFEQLERKRIADITPGWRWCLNTQCKAGQVHHSTQGQPVSSSPDIPLAQTSSSRQNSLNPPGSGRTKNGKRSNEELGHEGQKEVCTCHECGAIACVPCDRPWHEGETCSQYQARIKDRLDEEDKTLRQIQLRTKPCPVCKKRIEKNGGCPVVHCTQCNSNFCWTCGTAVVNYLCACIPPTDAREA